MSQSKGGILAQDWITSTRKYAHGMMQKLLDENLEAERAGGDPPYKVYTWCVFESASAVTNCMEAYPDHPEPCGCDKVVKGAWDDGSPRRFNEICKGRLTRSNGFMSLYDLHKTFRSTNQEVYEAQQLCTKPETSGLVFPQFERSKHGIKWWDPDPNLGPIYMGVDFGSTNPSAVNWYQVLNYDTMAYGFYQQKIEDPQVLIPAGARVCFDELYIAETGNIGLAEKVVEREKLWRKQHPNFKVTMRFADVQNKAGRIDWAQYKTPLPTSFFATRDIKEQIKTCRELFREKMIWVDTVRCEMFCEEAEYYHYPKKQAHREYDPEIPVDDFNHVMSNFRYCMVNLHRLDTRKVSRSGSYRARPASGPPRHRQLIKAGRPRYLPLEEKGRHPMDNRIIQ